MAEDKDILRVLREAGVKSAKFGCAAGCVWVNIRTKPDDATSNVSFSLESVEFFPEPALSFEATDDEPATGEGEPVVAVPPALARMLKRGSVS